MNGKKYRGVIFVISVFVCIQTRTVKTANKIWQIDPIVWLWWILIWRWNSTQNVLAIGFVAWNSLKKALSRTKDKVKFAYKWNFCASRHSSITFSLGYDYVTLTFCFALKNFNMYTKITVNKHVALKQNNNVTTDSHPLWDGYKNIVFFQVIDNPKSAIGELRIETGTNLISNVFGGGGFVSGSSFVNETNSCSMMLLMIPAVHPWQKGDGTTHNTRRKCSQERRWCEDSCTDSKGL